MKALTKNLLTAACLVTAAFSLNACISNNGNDIDSKPDCTQVLTAD